MPNAHGHTTLTHVTKCAHHSFICFKTQVFTSILRADTFTLKSATNVPQILENTISKRKRLILKNIDAFCHVQSLGKKTHSYITMCQTICMFGWSNGCFFDEFRIFKLSCFLPLNRGPNREKGPSFGNPCFEIGLQPPREAHVHRKRFQKGATRPKASQPHVCPTTARVHCNGKRSVVRQKTMGIS